MFRKTFAEIDLRAIGNNIKVLKQKAGNDKKILLPVKADAYGHGIVEVSRYVEKNSLIDMLGVATLDEGIELRNAGIRLPILVLGLIIPNEESIQAILDYDLTQVVANILLPTKISHLARLKGKKARVHLKVDTGMGRIGCRPEDAAEIAVDVASLESIQLEGICTHFPVADEEDTAFTTRQIKTFANILIQVEKQGIHIPLRHSSNSAGIVYFQDETVNMIRPGIMSYGYFPAPGIDLNGVKLEPAMSLKSCIIFSKRVSKGVALSYGLTYTTPADSNIATIAIGYGDGYSRSLSNRAKVIIRGKTYPVVGRVTMDQLLINLGNDDYPLGEEVTLFGREIVTINTIADWTGTISYEVTCSISKRVPRLYKE
ncbi:MAG: alanine racemase [Spirochaetae bacterium HGW-Spirochaetae-1]|jgi:alanine racemase|nr:MAG: alanine racemase [Spirochaetae bacterium HGW-Spirochaetae-1]